MAQKDKVKELVGRGLDSYHTKALQQIDRIDKKNKEQNHKISILSNELDNDYLTKTEEGSVVSLEHSKEGMVYLDELQGNTLVNYCTDGSKELTLNGDIDTQGTFITTTEGVDNGLVDVMCEGDTLVNAWTLRDENPYSPNISSNLTSKVTIDTDKTFCKITINENLSLVDGNKWIVLRAYPEQYCRDMIKLNTTYTLIFNLDYNFNLNSNADISIANNVSNHFVRNKSFMPKQGLNKVVITTVSEEPEDRTGQHIYIGFPNFLSTDVIGKYFKFSDFYMLEGDWTDREIPPFFEGMKSVGQDDENGHKIEILSQTLNLVDDFSKYVKGSNQTTFTKINNHSFSVEGSGSHTWQQVNFNIPFIQNAKAGDTFTLFAEEITLLNQDTSSDIEIQMRNTTLNISISNSWKVNANKPIRNGSIKFTIPNNYNGTDILDLRVHVNHGVALANKVTIKNLMIAKGHVDISSFKPYGLNKKEILINEPLRSLPNGVRDEIIKQNGKWYVKRKLNETYIEVPSSGVTVDIIQDDKCRIIMADYPINIKPKQITTTINVNCDKIPSLKQTDLDDTSPNYSYGISTRIATTKGIYMWVTKDKMPNQTLDGFKDFIKNNQPKIIYELETPIYEEIIDVELITYLDVTHISNNSIIPCNMKIKNTGYNAIIKPSTLYTVALDTNKSGTIGMNLGGAKVTTTNNVAKLTTPATLTDDSLRLYGKGIKGSKVRLLEGDKTNWIPSFFEGMKSSFEDKVQSDGTYKMEILSNNKNLIKNGEKYKNWDGYTPYQKLENGFILEYSVGRIAQNTVSLSNLKHGETYTFSCDVELLTPLKRTLQVYRFGDIKQDYGTSTNTSRKLIYTFKHDSSMPNIGVYLQGDEHTTAKANITNIQLEKKSTNTECIDRKYNKIQFSSIEPLRKWDRFVFKDNQLMIERGSLSFTVGNSRTWIYDTSIASPYYKCNIKDIIGAITQDITMNNILCDKLPIKQVYTSNSNYGAYVVNSSELRIRIEGFTSKEQYDTWLATNPLSIICTTTTEPTYEEIPFELQKIILEGYENGTLFFDTNIPPTSTVTYAGETPIVKSVRLNKTEVSNNTTDINDNIIPYLCDMDYRIVTLELQQEQPIQADFYKIFGGVYEMLKRDILSKRLSKSEYEYRLTDYFNVGKLTEQQVRELEDLINE